RTFLLAFFIQSITLRNMANSQPVVLSIAGFDPCSGAGITADIKTIAAHNCYALSCITALTVQSTNGVVEVQPVSPRLVADTLRELAKDLDSAANRVQELGARQVVVSGGDTSNGQPGKAIDLLSIAGSIAPLQEEFASERLRSRSTHGIGCAFASALAANLALGKQLSNAVVLSKAYVKKAIASAHPLGRGGHGPLNHLYRLEEVPLPAHDTLAAAKE